ncbi:MAG: helix-turn-helix domain-containing protein [Alphaproteobacteria bacterium]|nr:helix-turn-helix domain-containing protein [Alphaproteobacteria bacterium]
MAKAETGNAEAAVAFGRLVRERRLAQGLSVRAAAAAARLSPSYLVAIEAARNPSTGGAPRPSVAVLRRLARALGLPAEGMHGVMPGMIDAGPGHVLLYRFDDGPALGAPALESLAPGRVDQWLYIADPRYPDPAPGGDGDTLLWSWPFGAPPYAEAFLVPERIIEALRSRAAALAARVRPGARLGLIIDDCSAVMRRVINPETEVLLEATWVERASAALAAAIGRLPVVLVCAYRHDDIEALAGQIDVLDTVVRLIGAHADVVTLDADGGLHAGARAIEGLLVSCRPAGAASGTWRRIAAAAARGLAEP